MPRPSMIPRRHGALRSSSSFAYCICNDRVVSPDYRLPKKMREMTSNIIPPKTTKARRPVTMYG